MTATNDLFVNESPVAQGPQDETTYTIDVSASDGSTVALTDGGNLDMQIYKNGTGSDLSSTLTSGSMSVSGNTLTTKVIKNLVGNNTYTCVFIATVNGSKRTVAKLDIICPSDKKGQ